MSVITYQQVDKESTKCNGESNENPKGDLEVMNRYEEYNHCDRLVTFGVAPKGPCSRKQNPRERDKYQ